MVTAADDVYFDGSWCNSGEIRRGKTGKPGDADRSYVVSVSALQYHQFLQDAVCY